MAKGFHQTCDLDYTEMFSPIVKPNTVRLVISLALSWNWPIWQLDIHNAFLNGDLNEEVFVEQPPGFHVPSSVPLVCKLHKALYGLKQSTRAWFTKLSSCLLQWGFHSFQGRYIYVLSSYDICTCHYARIC